MKEFKIEVTRVDMLAGSRGTACYCPIALALNRNFGSKAEATVTSRMAFITLEGKRWSLKCSPATTQWINAYDSYAIMLPFTATFYGRELTEEEMEA